MATALEAYATIAFKSDRLRLIYSRETDRFKLNDIDSTGNLAASIDLTLRSGLAVCGTDPASWFYVALIDALVW